MICRLNFWGSTVDYIYHSNV